MDYHAQFDRCCQRYERTYGEWRSAGKSDLHAPTQRLTSACTLTYVLRALFCEVARPRYNVHIYLQNITSARVCRCHDSSSEHIQEPRTLLNFPYIHSHIQSHSPRAPPWPLSPASCGLVLAVNQPPASLLAASFSPAGAIH